MKYLIPDDTTITDSSIIENSDESGTTFQTWDHTKTYTVGTKVAHNGEFFESLKNIYPLATYSWNDAAYGIDPITINLATGERVYGETSPPVSFDTSGNAYGVTSSSDGNTAYIADVGSGLQIIDVSTATPFLLSTFDTYDHAYGVTLSSDNTKAYVAIHTGGLQIIDISTPTAPTHLGSINTDGYAYGVTLSSDNTKAYVADGWEGLQIIDISNPAAPTLLGTLNTDGYARGVTLSSDDIIAYVADGHRGLQIIDVSIPTAPSLLGTFGTPGDAMGVTLSSDNNIAYVADDSSGLQIIDVSIPTAPSLLGTFGTPGDAKGVTLSSDNTKAYVAIHTSGLQIIDISTPTTPSLLSTLPTSGNAYGVTLSSDNTKAYVADDSSGLQIIYLSDPFLIPCVGDETVVYIVDSWKDDTNVAIGKYFQYTGSTGLVDFATINPISPANFAPILNYRHEYHEPVEEVDSIYWDYVGATNRNKVVDKSYNSQSIRENATEVWWEFETSNSDRVVLFNLQAQSAEIICYKDDINNPIYTNEITSLLNKSPIRNWRTLSRYKKTYTNNADWRLPFYTGTITVRVILKNSTASLIKLGEILQGALDTYGLTLDNVPMRIKSSGEIIEKSNGDIVVEDEGDITKVFMIYDFSLLFDSDTLDSLVDKSSSLIHNRVVILAEDTDAAKYRSLNVYGLIREASPTFSSASEKSKIKLQIQRFK